ncbi:MAG: hypothetical protein LQ338_002347 [Usnochroma carphineum]|nr:MAG: hypothetical protein LQ338_002347 [Usnochroma carphineum]
MADDERRGSKRSRFDQTEPEPKRSSRFDRRSRSPSRRQSETRRSRSPLAPSNPLSPRATESKGPKAFAADPATAAAAAAARINAQIQAKKGIQHVDVPPIRSVGKTGTRTSQTLTRIQTGSPAASASSPPARSGSSTSNINGEMYIADGDYIRDIEINDLRNKYTLTKGSTQKMSMATAANPPLYLHITSTSKAGLEKAVQKIEELMKQDLPNLVDERRFRRREPEQVERDEFGRRKWPEERIPIDLEPIPGFNLRAQVVGHGGAYVKHIQQETRCRVQIKGRNSGFMEHSTGRESDEPMYLHVAGPDPKEVQRARELCEDLLANVKEQYERFKENPPQRSYGYGQDNRQQAGYSTANPYGTYGAGGVQSPATPSTAATPGPPGASSQTDYTAQYAQYYANQPGGDPYAAWGGYANYVAYYQYYQQAAQQQQQQPGGAPGAGAPPAPPGGDEPPPPPPPPPSESPAANGGYNNVGF